MPWKPSTLDVVAFAAAMNGGAVGSGMIGVSLGDGASRQTFTLVFGLAVIGAVVGMLPGAFLLTLDRSALNEKEPDGRARPFGRRHYAWLVLAFLAGAFVSPLVVLICVIPLGVTSGVLTFKP